MASVFKRKGKGRWIIQYTDYTGRRRERSSRTTDHIVALRIGAELDARVAERRMGLVDPRADAFAEQDRRPICEHIADFESLLQARGRAASHVVATRRSIERVVKQVGARRLSDLSAFKVQTAVVVLREEPILVSAARRRRSQARALSASRQLTERPMYRSARTYNKLLQAMTSFTRWLWRDGRMPSNPLLAVTRLNVDVNLALEEVHLRVLARRVHERQEGVLQRIAHVQARPAHHRAQRALAGHQAFRKEQPADPSRRQQLLARCRSGALGQEHLHDPRRQRRAHRARAAIHQAVLARKTLAAQVAAHRIARHLERLGDRADRTSLGAQPHTLQDLTLLAHPSSGVAVGLNTRQLRGAGLGVGQISIVEWVSFQLTLPSVVPASRG